MNYKGIIITGTSGSGKTTIVKNLLLTDDRFEQVKAVTTREKREDDASGVYDYISKQQFTSLEEKNELLVSTNYRDNRYGIKESVLLEVIGRSKIPVLVLTPESAKSINGVEPVDDFPALWLSIFLDAEDELLNKRLEIRDSKSIDSSILKQREQDRKYKDCFTYLLTNNYIDKCVKLVLALWDNAKTGGVLTARIISLMIDCNLLLENAKKENTQGASYDLSLGDQYFYKGKIHRLSEKDPILLIEPYDYAIITSFETVNLPKDICGRFDLTVSLFCQGVILSNGPQVDPGFMGLLFCLVLNTSNSPVLLKRRQHYATIEFTKLCEPTYSYRGKNQAKELLHYIPDNAAQGAISDLKKEIEKVRDQGQNLQNTTWSILSMILALIAIWVSFR